MPHLKSLCCIASDRLINEALYELRDGGDFLIAHTASHIPHHPIQVIGAGPGAKALESRVKILGVLSGNAWELSLSQTGTSGTVTAGAGSKPGGWITAAINTFTQLCCCRIRGSWRLVLGGIVGGDIPKVLFTEGGYLGAHLGICPRTALEIHQLLVNISGMLSSELGPDRNQSVSVRAMTSGTCRCLGFTRRGIAFLGPARCLGTAGNERRCNRNRNQPSLHGMYRPLFTREPPRQRQSPAAENPRMYIRISTCWSMLAFKSLFTIFGVTRLGK